MMELELFLGLMSTAVLASLLITLVMPEPKPPKKPKKYGESIRKKRMLRKNER